MNGKLEFVDVALPSSSTWRQNLPSPYLRGKVAEGRKRCSRLANIYTGAWPVKTVFSLGLRKKFVRPAHPLQTDSPLQTYLLVPKKNGARAAFRTVAAGEWGMLGLTNCCGRLRKLLYPLRFLDIPSPVDMQVSRYRVVGLLPVCGYANVRRYNGLPGTCQTPICDGIYKTEKKEVMARL